MDADAITAYFTLADGRYRFARWGRPLAPVVFGVEPASLATIKDALRAVTSLAGQALAETDPELGVNCMIFFFRDWAELRDVPDLDRLIPDLAPLIDRLEASDAQQYRAFRFDDAGALQAAFLFVRMAGAQADLPAEELALSLAVQAILCWGDAAFATRSPLARLPQGTAVLRPEIGALIRAAYDPVLPAMADDPSHALRLAARIASGGSG